MSHEELIDRLKESMRRIGKMCSEGHGPRMRIPATPDDDDLFINNTIREAIKALSPSPADGWVACSERLPECKGKYLTVIKPVLGILDGEPFVKFQWFIPQEHPLISGWQHMPVTHWMSLPEPPHD